MHQLHGFGSNIDFTDKLLPERNQPFLSAFGKRNLEQVSRAAFHYICYGTNDSTLIYKITLTKIIDVELAFFKRTSLVAGNQNLCAGKLFSLFGRIDSPQFQQQAACMAFNGFDYEWPFGSFQTACSESDIGQTGKMTNLARSALNPDETVNPMG